MIGADFGPWASEGKWHGSCRTLVTVGTEAIGPLVSEFNLLLMSFAASDPANTFGCEAICIRHVRDVDSTRSQQPRPSGKVI